MQTLTVAVLFLLRTISKIWAKSPPSKIKIPPNIFSLPRTFCNVQLTVLKQKRYCIETLSQIIKWICANKRAVWSFFLIVQIKKSLKLIGIRKRKCAVRPLGKSKAAMLKKAIYKTILRRVRKWAAIALYKKVLLILPGLSRKN